MRSELSFLAKLSVAAIMAFAMLPLGCPRAADTELPQFSPQVEIEDPDDQAFDAGEPEDPEYQGREGMGRPYARERKENRGDLLGGDDSSQDPEIRAITLDRLYDQLGSAKDEKSAEQISEAIEQAWRNSGSDTVDLLMTRVDGFILDADLDLALEVLDAATELAPQDAEVWHQRALVNFMKGDSKRALTDLNRALQADPRHYKALRDLGVVLRETGDKKGALEAYRKALKINPFLDQAKAAEQELTHDVEGRDI